MEQKIEDLIKLIEATRAATEADNRQRDARVELLAAAIQNLTDPEIPARNSNSPPPPNPSVHYTNINNNNNNTTTTTSESPLPTDPPKIPNAHSGPQVKLHPVKEEADDEELEDALLNKKGASFVGDIPKPAPKKPEGTTSRNTLDFTVVDDSDEETDPEQREAALALFKGVVGKFKKSKKSSDAKKKLKTAESFGEWTRRLLKAILRVTDPALLLDLLLRYNWLITWVGWLNKYKGWKIARAYGNTWLKEERKRELKKLPVLDFKELNKEILARAEVKAGRPAKEEKKTSEKTSSTTSVKISDEVYSRFPCDNCTQHGHWSLRCPKPCKYCGAKHNCRTCPKNPNFSNNNNNNGQGGGSGGSASNAPSQRK